MKSVFKLMMMIGLLASVEAFAHGEDKPGPHGGYIRMPGSFHTEVVSTGTSIFKVYLLDLEWKKPLVKDSQAKLSFISQASTLSAPCVAKNDFFLCTFTKKLPAVGELRLEATRAKQSGNIAVYPWPLRFEIFAAPGEHGSGH